MHARRWIIAASAVALAAAIGPPGIATATTGLGDEPNAAPHDIELLSRTSSGQTLSVDTHSSGISGDGNVVVFESSGDYTETGLPGGNHTFARDRSDGATVLVNARADGSPSIHRTGSVSVSETGRYVAFTSFDDQMVPDDTNESNDVFLRDLLLGTTVLVSTSTDGDPAAGSSYGQKMSPDGSSVAFSSNADDLVEGVAVGARNAFVRDVATGQTTLLSRGRDGAPANGDTGVDDWTPDGRYVVLSSEATNLTRGDHDRLEDLFLLDTVTGKYTKLTKGKFSVRRDYVEGVISADGSTVALHTKKPLVEEDTNGISDVYAYDVAAKTFQLLSVTAGGRPTKNPSYGPTMSGDGRLVAYTAQHPHEQVRPRFRNCLKWNVVVRDLVAGTVTIAGRDVDGRCVDGQVRVPYMSASGHLIFQANAALHPDDTDTKLDVYGADLT